MVKKIVGISLILASIVSCNQVQKATDLVTRPTARTVYSRDFDKNDFLYNTWNTAFAKAKKEITAVPLNNLLLELPHTTVGTFSTSYIKPYSYTFTLAEGEILIAEVHPKVDSTRVFMDLYSWKNDSLLSEKALTSNDLMGTSLKWKVKRSGLYTLFIQPEITSVSPFSIKIFSEPQYAFPVSDKGNEAVQSFWGAPRSGGKRKHKGIDIFAARGTPVIAVTEGYISYTGNRGLGGKQVWLRDGIFGQSLYYAHLDSIIAKRGQYVQVGDTLGHVGNTGNAKTTPPHLHFGIYKRSGAINPYPFVKYSTRPTIKDSLKSSLGLLKTTGNLRILPRAKAEKLAKLQRKDTVLLLEQTNNWYRVRANDSIEGYMYKSSVRPI